MDDSPISLPFGTRMTRKDGPSNPLDIDLSHPKRAGAAEEVGDLGSSHGIQNTLENRFTIGYLLKIPNGYPNQRFLSAITHEYK